MFEIDILQKNWLGMDKASKKKKKKEEAIKIIFIIKKIFKFVNYQIIT